MKRSFVVVTGISLILSLAACSKSSTTTSSQASAVVKAPVVEAQLNTITLTAAATQRLGIELATVENKVITRTRILGGELVSPSGQELVVAAPFAGVIVANAMPQPGTQLKQGAAVLGLLPIAAGNAGSDDNLQVKQAEFRAAANRMDRAEKLLAARGASTEEVEQARAQLAQAQSALNLVVAQRAVAQGRTLTGGAELAPMPMTSPQSGILQSVLVASGQTVAAGQLLFQVQSQQPLWVKVPVFSGDLAEVDTHIPARVAALGSTLLAGIPAIPVNGPRTTRAGSAALDVFYRIDNADSALRAGEQVRIALPIKQGKQSLVVPYSAIYQDMYGSSYVYERTADNVFVRRRVEVRDVSDGQAVLTRGIAAGAQVVTVGVAELAGAEFGVAK